MSERDDRTPMKVSQTELKAYREKACQSFTDTLAGFRCSKKQTGDMVAGFRDGMNSLLGFLVAERYIEVQKDES